MDHGPRSRGKRIARQGTGDPPGGSRDQAASRLLERIVRGRTDLVLDWLEQGGAADADANDGVPLLGWCAYYGDLSAVRLLLSHGAELAALGDNLDLNGAAFHGHWRLCEFLIENGAAVDHPLPDTGETPLHAALTKAESPAHELVVRVLLAAGADPNRATTPGVETGAFMRDCRTRGETPLHRAAAFASEDAIQRLLDAGAVLDARDAHGDTPLAWASWHLRPASVLRKLCFGEHAIHPRSAPLATHLLGRPEG